MPRLSSPPTGLEARCNTILADIAAQLATAQPAWRDAEVGEPGMDGRRTTRARFAQLLGTHLAPPVNGQETASNGLARAADATWATLGVTLPDTLPLNLEVHVHDGPAGIGHTLIGTLVIAGRTWRRAVHVGPYGHMGHGWQQQVDSV